MELGQNYRCGFYDIPPAQRMEAIKRAGFDSTMLWWGEEYSKTDGTKEELYALAKKNGLNIHTVHFPSTYAHYLWLGGDEGSSYMKQLLQAIRDCGRLEIPNMVLHMTRKLITVPPNETGLEHMQTACKEAETQGIRIAVENTRFLKYNTYVYNNIDSPALKFCFDTGHANCYTHDEDPLGMFGSRLVTTHIHDNYGPAGHPDGLVAPSGDKDLHNLIGDGNIDFQKLFERMQAQGNTVWNLESYCFKHSKYYGLTIDDYLSLSYKKLTSLIDSSRRKK